MKIAISTVLTDFKGKALKDENQNDLTLKEVCLSAVLGQTSEKVGGMEKTNCFKLAMRLNEATETIDLAPEEIAVIKALIDKFFHVIVVGRSFELLNG